MLVAEVMLQQTQVARVLPRYEEFLDRWPSPAACAAAPVGEVVGAWVGLGYNRRAVNLHRCARVVTDEHRGRLPEDLAELLALPGIGPYTARALLAFAHERESVGVVDTNAARVLARWAGRSLGAKEVQRAADAAVPAGHAWAWNQAMLDLGATVCVARAPACEICPTATGCRWREEGNGDPDPAVGSAGASGRQSRFAGSDRQGRGRLVAAMCLGPVAGVDLGATMGWPDDVERSARVAATVVADGLAQVDDTGTHHLPS